MPVTDIANEWGSPRVASGATASTVRSTTTRPGWHDVGSAVTGALGLQGVPDWLAASADQRRSDFARQAAKGTGAVIALGTSAALATRSTTWVAWQSTRHHTWVKRLQVACGGPGAMTGTRAAMSAARELGMPRRFRRGSARRRGSVAGAVAANYPSSVGDIMSNQREKVVSRTALLPSRWRPVRGSKRVWSGRRSGACRPVSPAVNWFDQAGGIRSGLKRAGVTALTQGAQEGASETFQEVMNQAGPQRGQPLQLGTRARKSHGALSGSRSLAAVFWVV